MTRVAGWLIVLYGTAHTVLALTYEGAAGYAGTWFSGGLWHEDFATMSPANSALWLSLGSFGVPLVLVGATVLWMAHHDVVPPPFIGWTVIVWTAVDAVIELFTPWPLILLAGVLLLVGIHRERRRPGARVSPAG